MSVDREQARRVTLYYHVRKDSLRKRSATVADPPFESFDVVLRRDYDALLAELEQADEALNEGGAPTESGGFALGVAGRIRALRFRLITDANRQRARAEQAERERDGERARVKFLESTVAHADKDYAALKAQLAKVPALEAVKDAAKALHDFLENEKATDEPPSELRKKGYAALETMDDYMREEHLCEELAAALAAFEQEQGEHGLEACFHDGEAWKAICTCGWETWDNSDEGQARSQHTLHRFREQEQKP